MTGFPITSTLMGLGAIRPADKQWLGMLGMHGTYEANMAMHDCDVMICLGARFDDRITGRTTSLRAGRQEDPYRYRPVLDQQDHGACRYRHHRRCRHVMEEMMRSGRRAGGQAGQGGAEKLVGQIESGGRAIRSPIAPNKDVIMPQYAIERLYEASTFKARTPTSPPKWASTRCGRRSSSVSRSRTAG
jgi:acetolactate synthase-1/2/3 large subunit